MPWVGGVYSRTDGDYNGSDVWEQNRINGLFVRSDRHDDHDQDLADGVNSCLHKGGQNSPTADIAMGGYKFENVGQATERNEFVTAGQVQDGGVVYGGVSIGSANAHEITVAPSIATYATGQRFNFISGFTNVNRATTLNVNGIGPIGVKFIKGATGDKAELLPGHLAMGHPAEVFYDGTDFILLNPASIVQQWEPNLTAVGSSFSVVPDLRYAWFQPVGDAIMGGATYGSGSVGVGTTRFRIDTPALPAGPTDQNLGTAAGRVGGITQVGFIFNAAGTPQKLDLYTPDTSEWPNGTVSYLHWHFHYAAA